MRVALWIANMLKAETLAGRKAEGTVALPSHLSPGYNDDHNDDQLAEAKYGRMEALNYLG